MTRVSVSTRTHSVTYVTDNILKSLKDIIRLSGLDPSGFVGDWATYQRAVGAWLGTGHLRTVMLEIYDPWTDGLITRWDVEIDYGQSGDGAFWTDTEQLRHAMRKAGIIPERARYGILLDCRPGRPDVQGWGPAYARSLDGMRRQSLGTTIEHDGLGARTGYWRRA